jgi:hypothetical protein
MIETITNYRPGIYGEIARRAEARAAREERWRHRIDCAADLILGSLAFSWLTYVGWFLSTL